MKKLEKIERDAQKARERIAAMQALLKQIDGKRTEQENLQIIQQVRALKLSRDELYSFISGGELPPALASAFAGTDTTAAPETIYSRRGRTRHHEPDTSTEPNGTDNTTNLESEGMNNEE